ncbi:MAG: fumarylacetoacetate hydrolase family protein [Methanobrevibacter sp.]|jgi:2-keto-4-pentenoate hydratase/2-oxohepta-3-ene-1,7-dioic acid hydratase in catechol pathway|nr:fumarylacetoacetate hydrolase family protein [Candidatus Methanoflexus mossambicus]
MKIIRFKEKKEESFGIYDDSQEIVKKIAINSLEEIFRKNEKELIENIIEEHILNEIKILTPVIPSKIVCVGLNYKNHAKELNMKIPNEPKIFIKPNSSIIGHLEDIIYPKESNELDYEGELAIVISKKSKNIPSEIAKEYIGGYTILNDITARDIQRKEIQWTRAKSFDTFAPIGPWIETNLNPKNQKITTKVNGEIKQESNTKNMIFSPYKLVEFISSIMTLLPGDIISTGTPPGVGNLNIGDNVEIAIEDIGILKNFVKADNPPINNKIIQK